MFKDSWFLKKMRDDHRKKIDDQMKREGREALCMFLKVVGAIILFVYSVYLDAEFWHFIFQRS